MTNLTVWERWDYIFSSISMFFYDLRNAESIIHQLLKLNRGNGSRLNTIQHLFLNEPWSWMNIEEWNRDKYFRQDLVVRIKCKRNFDLTLLIFNNFSVQYLSLTLTLLAVVGFAGSYAYQVRNKILFSDWTVSFDDFHWIKIFNLLRFSMNYMKTKQNQKQVGYQKMISCWRKVSWKPKVFSLWDSTQEIVQ